MSESAASSLEGRRIVLGVTGSIAAYKAAPLIRLLTKAGCEVQVLMTEAAEAFISRLTLGTLSGRDVLIDIFPDKADAATDSWTRHVELGLWADLMVVAPATAQTIAKLANGFCDSMLTATALSARCPLLVCPAMDHDMYGHPATRRNLELLESYGHRILPAEHGELASGLVGDGRMPEPETIVQEVRAILDEESSSSSNSSGNKKLAGKKVLVTAGPTREPIDPARHLSNPSSGRMGFALAEAAAEQGANVVLISGTSSLQTPAHVQRVDIITAEEMLEACRNHRNADLVLMAAAVSDYRPKNPSSEKRKKTRCDLTLKLERTPDILKSLTKERRDGQYFLGFALETDDGEANARRKLDEKNLDWIALNSPQDGRSGFQVDTNEITLFGRDGTRKELALQSKSALARQLINHIAEAIK